MAAIVTGGSATQEYLNLIAHGTNCNISEDFDYASTLKEQSQDYLDIAKQAYYNSTPKFNECIPHTYNLLSSLSHFSDINLAKTVALLAPLVNVQSQWLMDSELEEERK